MVVDTGRNQKLSIRTNRMCKTDVLHSWNFAFIQLEQTIVSQTDGLRETVNILSNTKSG